MLMNIIALYDADKLAHEEAVRNGGVCPFFFLSPMLTPTKLNYFSLYFTGMAFQIKRPA